MKSPEQEISYFYNEIEVFSDLIKLSERLWPEELSKYEPSLIDDDEKYGERFEHRRDLSNKLKSEYPQLQRRSYLVMLLALFEDFLNQLCYSLEKNKT